MEPSAHALAVALYPAHPIILDLAVFYLCAHKIWKPRSFVCVCVCVAIKKRDKADDAG